jgi:hypothetical protein
MYLPTADGGSCITDALTQTYKIVNMGRSLRGEAPIAPKNGARFHFSLPGSVQGFIGDGATVSNTNGKLSIKPSGPIGRAATATFIPPDSMKLMHYNLFATPTLYPGEQVTANISADADANVTLFIHHYDDKDSLARVDLMSEIIPAGSTKTIKASVPDVGGQPIAQIGIETTAAISVDSIDWTKTPTFKLRCPTAGDAWRRAWVAGADSVQAWGVTHPEINHIVVVQNTGAGLAINGTRDWKDYRVAVRAAPHLARSFGLAARVQGMRRYYAVLVASDGKAKLVRMLNESKTLAESPVKFEFGRIYDLSIEAKGSKLKATVDGKTVLEATDDSFATGAIGLISEEGRVVFGEVDVKAL